MPLIEFLVDSNFDLLNSLIREHLKISFGVKPKLVTRAVNQNIVQVLVILGNLLIIEVNWLIGANDVVLLQFLLFLF